MNIFDKTCQRIYASLKRKSLVSEDAKIIDGPSNGFTWTQLYIKVNSLKYVAIRASYDYKISVDENGGYEIMSMTLHKCLIDERMPESLQEIEDQLEVMSAALDWIPLEERLFTFDEFVNDFSVEFRAGLEKALLGIASHSDNKHRFEESYPFYPIFEAEVERYSKLKKALTPSDEVFRKCIERYKNIE